MFESLAANGSLFVVRECDAEDDCIVIERYGGVTGYARMFLPGHDPTDDLHIPLSVVRSLLPELQRLCEHKKGGE